MSLYFQAGWKLANSCTGTDAGLQLSFEELVFLGGRPSVRNRNKMFAEKVCHVALIVIEQSCYELLALRNILRGRYIDPSADAEF